MTTQADAANSARTRRFRVPQWVGEILLVAAIYVVYEFARGLPGAKVSRADSTGRALLRWERAVHLDPEKWLTVHLDHLTVLAVPAAYFYATMHYIITPIVLVWLYLQHRNVYGRARTWLAVSTMIALVVFYLVPTTPPRLLHRGYPDVLKDVSAYGWWSGEGSAPRGLGHLTNQLAAMSSMHLGWALWCAVMIYRHCSHTWVRWVGVAYPVLTSLIVLSTGNHYLLDLVGGAVVMGVGGALTVLFSALLRRGHGAGPGATPIGAERPTSDATPVAAVTPGPDVSTSSPRTSEHLAEHERVDRPATRVTQ